MKYFWLVLGVVYIIDRWVMYFDGQQVNLYWNSIVTIFGVWFLCDFLIELVSKKDSD